MNVVLIMLGVAILVLITAGFLVYCCSAVSSRQTREQEEYQDYVDYIERKKRETHE